MKKYITIALILLGSYNIKAQQLNVPLISQEHDQWCWSGCTTCMLNYYGFPVTQCDVAEYARTASTIINFGTVNCCVDATQGCNQPNYDWGYSGSMTDILHHFGNINCGTANNALSLSTIQNNVAHNHLMIFHWSWLPIPNGGHFVVGTGVSGGNVYYMNPWPGDGYQMDSYASLLNDGVHQYDGTVTVLSPTDVSTIPTALTGEIVYPNPSTGGIYVRNATSLKVFDAMGQLAYQQSVVSSDLGSYVDLSALAKGTYFVSVNEGKENNFTKLVLQ